MEQPTSPQVHINITPQGMVITAQLAPGLLFQQVVGEDSMNQIVAEWLKTRQEIKRQLELVHLRDEKYDAAGYPVR